MLQNDAVIKWQRKSNTDKCKAVHKRENNLNCVTQQWALIMEGIQKHWNH